ncbi:MAG: Holliday junction branch migration protein RuvA [Lachnospiraceae bacterium]|nr:Holliday junction branch migration protein RuvA [Lachnospiraceae bacterium]
MVSYIKGIVAQINENHIVLDNHGIGYQIQMPLSSMYSLKEGEEVTVHTYMAFGKDDISLCGFVSRSELEMFKLLLKVSGIGPKGALNILSGVNVDTLKMAIASGDDKLIAASKGISAKTAQKIIVELKGKVNKELLSGGINVTLPTSNEDTRVSEAISAVVATGFDRTSCVRALANIEITENMTVDEIIDLIFANITF